jgi:hypothetical protein
MYHKSLAKREESGLSAGVVTSLAPFAGAMPVKAAEAVDVGGGEGSLVGGRVLGSRSARMAASVRSRIAVT